MKYILIFLNGFIIDFLYALYTKNINVDKYGIAGFYSVLITLGGVYIGVLVYIDHQFFDLIPYSLGLWSGTYSIKYLKKYLIK
jgi:hypothetical protein